MTTSANPYELKLFSVILFFNRCANDFRKLFRAYHQQRDIDRQMVTPSYMYVPPKSAPAASMHRPMTGNTPPTGRRPGTSPEVGRQYHSSGRPGTSPSVGVRSGGLGGFTPQQNQMFATYVEGGRPHTSPNTGKQSSKHTSSAPQRPGTSPQEKNRSKNQDDSTKYKNLSFRVSRVIQLQSAMRF